MVILSSSTLKTFKLAMRKSPRPGSYHSMIAPFKLCSAEEFNMKLMLKARIFLAIVSDELQVLQQPAVLQHAKILHIEQKE